jgi:hypothetical protein
MVTGSRNCRNNLQTGMVMVMALLQAGVCRLVVTVEVAVGVVVHFSVD